MHSKNFSKIADLFKRSSIKAERENSISTSKKFFLVTGIGHCGTGWLAHALNQPKLGLVCYHQYKNTVTRVNWHASLQHEFEHGLNELFDSYWAFLQEQLRTYQIVGDSNSWTMLMIPKVTERIKVDQVIYLVRNGIQTVHSVFYHNTSMSRDDWLYTHFFRRYWQILGQPGEDWNNYSDWASWCFWWQVNEKIPGWLAEQIGSEKVTIYRFEDLLQDVDTLASLIRQLYPEINISVRELKKIQQRDINRKVRGDRSPERLWAMWTDEQREVFCNICGSGMAYYNYPIPLRP